MARSVDELRDPTSVVDPVVTLTEQARSVVLEALAQESESQRMALWLEVRGVESGAFAYDLYFQALADAAQDDAVWVEDDLAIVVPSASVSRLQGARLEWSDEGDGGLVLVNPNAPKPEERAAGIPAEILAAGLGGPVAIQVLNVLEASVNPSIAGHGGRADLVGMDEEGGVAYLRLSGGCQGCAMSRQTLTQGIEVSLKEQVPQVVRIVDVTDHGGGENPYY